MSPVDELQRSVTERVAQCSSGELRVLDEILAELERQRERDPGIDGLEDAGLVPVERVHSALAVFELVLGIGGGKRAEPPATTDVVPGDDAELGGEA